MDKTIDSNKIGSIFLLNIAVKEIIDFGLNPILMIKFDYVISLIITTIIYVFVGIISVRLYDRKGEDLFGIERNKTFLQKVKRPTIIGRIIALFALFVFGLISSLKNTRLPVIIFRDGSNLYNGFSGKYIKLIFLVYALIINVSWNIFIYLLSPLWIEIGKILKIILFSIIRNQMITF